MFGLETMNYPLPEDIAIRKYAGDLKGAIALIDLYLAENRTPLLNDRLKLERAIIEELPREFPLSRAEAFKLVHDAVPDITEAEFDRVELAGDILYVYIDGRKRYARNVASCLFKLRPEFAKRAGRSEDDKTLLNDAIAELKRNGVMSRRIHMRNTLRIADDAFKPDAYRVHMPLPALSAQQSDIRIVTPNTDDAYIAPEDAHARTACFIKRLEVNETFVTEFEYTSTIRYFDPDKPAPASPLYPAAGAAVPDDLSETPGHIVFTPYLKALCADVCGAESDPLRRARLIYEYVTTHVHYSYMREYFLLPSIAEYVATGLKGDCGVQALLFITLCRIAGIPARWQSGLYAAPGDPGMHDWAQFYVDGWGWLFCDPSFGGAAYRSGAYERWNFYFGNLDPYRMVANSRFQADFTPPRRHLRNDPYDNQGGECETEERALKPYELEHKFTAELV